MVRTHGVVTKDRKLIVSSTLSSKNEPDDKKWLSHELAGCEFKDKRHAKRLEKLLERLANLISIFCILSWRIFWLTMINRFCSNASPKLALTKMEINILDYLVENNGNHPKKNKLSDYLIKIAKLGGYLARASDPPPGNIVMWRGLSRLTDIELGFNLAVKFVGN